MSPEEVEELLRKFAEPVLIRERCTALEAPDFLQSDGYAYWCHRGGNILTEAASVLGSEGPKSKDPVYQRLYMREYRRKQRREGTVNDELLDLIGLTRPILVDVGEEIAYFDHALVSEPKADRRERTAA